MKSFCLLYVYPYTYAQTDTHTRTYTRSHETFSPFEFKGTINELSFLRYELFSGILIARLYSSYESFIRLETWSPLNVTHTLIKRTVDRIRRSCSRHVVLSVLLAGYVENPINICLFPRRGESRISERNLRSALLLSFRISLSSVYFSGVRAIPLNDLKVDSSPLTRRFVTLFFYIPFPCTVTASSLFAHLIIIEWSHRQSVDRIFNCFAKKFYEWQNRIIRREISILIMRRLMHSCGESL